MGLAITEEHRELAAVAAKFLNSQGKSLAREVTDGSAGRLNGLWSGMVAQGWPGLHLPEEFGGLGFGRLEQMVVLAEAGRVVAPVPLAATTIVSGLIAQYGYGVQLERNLTGLADGSRTAGVAMRGDATLSVDGNAHVLTGTWPAVLGGEIADVLALVVGDDVVLLDAQTAELTVVLLDAIDRTLNLAEVSVSASEIAESRILRGAAASLRALTLAGYAADALGNSEATLAASVAHALSREQFGRKIGSFQAIKHHCANMAVKTELAIAAVWDAGRTEIGDPALQFVAASAAALAFEAAIHNAQLNIQIHGGMGFTWEHDAHIFLRRAVALVQVLGPLADVHDSTFCTVGEGIRRGYAVDLPPEADGHRAEARRFITRYRSLDGQAARELAVTTGYLAPHWPKPYGRNAGPVEQLVIDEELAELELPNLGIGGWIMQTVLAHGTPDQISRWLQPALLGEHLWCQLFSEPDAGSDAAAIRTRAARAPGGWLVTGQKIWTSGAQTAQRGLATVRTDATGPKREGITTVVIDMQAPGVSVRPLRELTGQSMFNEVFFDAVFVADGDVLGEVGAGWRVARATLGNERVTIGGGAYRGIRAEELISLLASSVFDGDRGMQRRIGALIAEAHAMRLMGLRRAVRALNGSDPGNEGNVAKLLSAEHAQRVSELALEFSGAAAALGAAERVTFEYLFDRCLTIGGGTSEISRNVIAERQLGLPRDASLL